MTKEHATFLNSLPVVLHIPQHHFFIVHAGLLPFDPRYSPTDPRQPLSHRPVKKYDIEEDHPLSQDLHDDDLSSSNVEAFDDNSRAMLVLTDRQQPLSRLSKPTTDEMRTRQEDAILHRIPQNQKWWNLVNMRALRKNGQISR